MAREALGPVRRNRDDGTEPEAAAVGDAFDEPDDGVAADVAETEFVPVDELGQHQTPEDFDDWAYTDDRTQVISPLAAEPPPLALTADKDEPLANQELNSGTTEYSVEEAFAAEDAPRTAGADREEADEDVLEETPDFLQDTPDHDRLWFEQRPPRDFDFDN